eukprot:TRINITY_DN5208_c0_g1_i2.p1 TRINITY_DN5208_c0_g1~~TRINITY_DN5208_c0_g1_i2.p1  ORF type:complete len:844 (+),score=185.34 TRINITY_DN5208_c0_g1_i2:56-2587(+)
MPRLMRLPSSGEVAPPAEDVLTVHSANTGELVLISAAAGALWLETARSEQRRIREIEFYPSALRVDFPELNECHRLEWEEAPAVLNTLVRLCARSGVSMRHDSGSAGSANARFSGAALREWLASIGAPAAASPSSTPSDAAAVLSPAAAATPTPRPSLRRLCARIGAGHLTDVVLLVGPDRGHDVRSGCARAFERLRRRGVPAPHSLLDPAFIQTYPEFAQRELLAVCDGADREPTAGLLAAELCARGAVRRVYTLSTDGAERRAGVPADLLVECDGSVERARCTVCGTESEAAGKLLRAALAKSQRAQCKCGGMLRLALHLRGEGPMQSAEVRADFVQCSAVLALGVPMSAEQWRHVVAAVPADVPRAQIGADPASTLRSWEDPANHADVVAPWPVDRAIALVSACARTDPELSARAASAGVRWKPHPVPPDHSPDPAAAAASAIRAALPTGVPLLVLSAPTTSGPRRATSTAADAAAAIAVSEFRKLLAEVTKQESPLAAVTASDDDGPVMAWVAKALRADAPCVVVELCDTPSRVLRRLADTAALTVPHALLLRVGSGASAAPDGHLALCQPVAEALPAIAQLLSQPRTPVRPDPAQTEAAEQPAQADADAAPPDPPMPTRPEQPMPTRPEAPAHPGSPARPDPPATAGPLSPPPQPFQSPRPGLTPRSRAATAPAGSDCVTTVPTSPTTETQSSSTGEQVSPIASAGTANGGSTIATNGSVGPSSAASGAPPDRRRRTRPAAPHAPSDKEPLHRRSTMSGAATLPQRGASGTFGRRRNSQPANAATLPAGSRRGVELPGKHTRVRKAPARQQPVPCPPTDPGTELSMLKPLNRRVKGTL